MLLEHHRRLAKRININSHFFKRAPPSLLRPSFHPLTETVAQGLTTASHLPPRPPPRSRSLPPRRTTPSATTRPGIPTRRHTGHIAMQPRILTPRHAATRPGIPALSAIITKRPASPAMSRLASHAHHGEAGKPAPSSAREPRKACSA